MDVTVSRRHAEVPPALRAAAVDKIGRLDRFLEGMDRAEVHFFEESRRKAEKEVCEVTLVGHGRVVRCKVAAVDGFAAVDLAVEKLEHQLERLKTKVLRTRKLGAGERASAAAVVDDGGSDGEVTLADAVYITRSGREVVKKKSFAIRPITVDEAVLQMELVDHPFYFFTNAETGRAAVLYRRDDGDLGLIDSDSA
ncbi:MAG: ribosome hibernation-promoting factor, HPF/YfiA family [Acidimicrobiales bacterium]